MIDFLDGLRAIGEVHLTTVSGSVTSEDYARILASDSEDLGGRVLAREIVRNLVTNSGRSGLAQRVINGSTATTPTYWGIGTTVITPAAGDTSLTGETTNRKALSTIAAFATYYLRYAVTFTPSDFNLTVRGVALFTSSSGGDMWCEAATNTAKSTSQSLVTDWRIEIRSA